MAMIFKLPLISIAESFAEFLYKWFLSWLIDFCLWHHKNNHGTNLMHFLVSMSNLSQLLALSASEDAMGTKPLKHFLEHFVQKLNKSLF